MAWPWLGKKILGWAKKEFPGLPYHSGWSERAEEGQDVGGEDEDYGEEEEEEEDLGRGAKEAGRPLPSHLPDLAKGCCFVGGQDMEEEP